MDLGSIVGQMMQQGLRPGSSGRAQHAMGPSGLGGLGDVLGSVLGGGAGRSGGGGLGDLLGGLGGALSADSGVGGLSRGQTGGIGALAGALLGGGSGAAKGALGGGAMALLGTLAISALKNWQASQAGGAMPAAAVSEAEVQQMTSPQTAELCLRGMIEAAKADGQIGEAEIQRITGKLQEGGITAEEQQFVMTQMSQPADPRGLAAAIPSREVGAQVYAAALMAIAVDTSAEQVFLADLADNIGLDAGTVQRLHEMVGAPAP